MDGSSDFQDDMRPDPSDLCHSKPRIWPNIVEIPISAFLVVRVVDVFEQLEVLKKQPV